MNPSEDLEVYCVKIFGRNESQAQLPKYQGLLRPPGNVAAWQGDDNGAEKGQHHSIDEKGTETP